MITPINFDEPIEYICKDDKSDKKPTVWLFRQLTVSQENWLKRKISELSKANDMIALCEVGPEILSMCLSGAKNWNASLDREDAELLPGVKALKEKSLSTIPAKYRDELIAFCIRGYSEVDESEAKN